MPGADGSSRSVAAARARQSTTGDAAGKITKAGTSATSTKTGQSTQDPSTPAATGGSRRTARPAKPVSDDNPESGSDDERGSAGVIAAVERDLEAIRLLSPRLADSALAATALAMAYEIENPFNSATSKSMCAKALLETLDTLRELSPPAEEGDALDELASRRAVRLARSAAT